MQKIGYMMNNPYISVIITAYNRKEFLLDAFNSALNQTLDRNKYEIIVTKNFTDNKMDSYIERNGGKLVFFDKPGIGPRIADALKYAKGEVICFLEDDDLFTKEKLGYIYNIFLKNKNLIYINNARTYINEKGRNLSRNISKGAKREKNIIINDFNKKPINLLRIQQYDDPWGSSSSIAIRSSLLKRFRSALYCVNFAPDVFYYLISLISGDLLISNKELTKVMIHESTSNKMGDYESYIKNVLKFGTKDIANIILSKAKVKVSKQIQKYFDIFSKDQEINYLFYAGNYRKKVLLDYLQIFPYIIRASPKYMIIKNLRVALYIFAPERYRKLNYKITKKYFGNL